MYCVKCGVRLQDGAEACPLCGTPVWDPDGAAAREPNYPDTLPRHYRETNTPTAAALTAMGVLVIGVILGVCFKLYGRLHWGGYAIGGVLLFLIIAVLPLWFHRPRGEIFVPAAHAAAALFLLYVCLKTGGRWFLSFAFPVIGGSCLLSEALICLLKYVRRGRLFIIGGFLILLGGFAVLIEFFEHISFGTEMFLWSLFPLAGFGALGLFLIIAGMIRPLRNSLERKFFF